MSRENVQLVRRFYELWNEGESAAHLLHPQFEYVNPPDAVEPGTLHGIAAARAGVAKIREIFPEVRVEPESYLENGDDVVVILGTRARSKAGVETGWRGGHVWTIREGKLARLRWFNEVEQALEAAGLSE